MTAGTPILTIRPFTPPQLRAYFEKLGLIYSDVTKRRFNHEGVLCRYEEDWSFTQNAGTTRLAGTIDVIGWPLLAHLAYRLLLDCEPPRQNRLIEDRTMLLRCLTEYCCQHSRHSSDDPSGNEVRSRFDPAELRALVHETAIAITRSSRESISLPEFREVMSARIGASGVERNLAFVNSAGTDVLLVNFLFKAGLEHLGCEFIHKALREFTFAEAIVDQLKTLGAVATSKRESFGMEAQLNVSITGLLSPQWLGKEVWEHIHSQLMWEVYRESPEYEDPAAFRRREPALGLDVWCRIRDRLAEVWGDWGLFMLGSPRTRQPKPVAEHVDALVEAVTDSRLGDALFRLCSALHGVLAVRILNGHKALKLTGNMWEEQGVAPSDRPHQTTLHDAPDQRLRFFSPFKSGEETEEGSLRAAMARINAHRSDMNEELPEKCDLTFLVLIGAPLERICFRLCDLSHCNLSESNLSGADMQGAEMTHAWLYKANLARVNLKMADLSYSSFSQSNLEGTVLKEANLSHADFRKTKGLSVEQVLQATNWDSALFDPDFKAALDSRST